MKILVVEDDKTSNAMMEKILKPYGEVYTANNGLDALSIFEKIIEEGKYLDYIFLDIIIPKLDGIEFTKIIRNYEDKHHITKNKKTNIIIVSSIDNNNTKQELQDYKIKDYLVKPINSKELIQYFQKNN